MLISDIIFAANKYVVCPACARKIIVARRTDVAFKQCRCGCTWGILLDGPVAQFTREFA